jgi:hypothetical protein
VEVHEELLFTDLALFNRKLADWLVFYNASASAPHPRPAISAILQHQPECQRYWTHTQNGIYRKNDTQLTILGMNRRRRISDTPGTKIT